MKSKKLLFYLVIQLNYLIIYSQSINPINKIIEKTNAIYDVKILNTLSIKDTNQSYDYKIDYGIYNDRLNFDKDYNIFNPELKSSFYKYSTINDSIINYSNIFSIFSKNNIENILTTNQDLTLFVDTTTNQIVHFETSFDFFSFYNFITLKYFAHIKSKFPILYENVKFYAFNFKGIAIISSLEPKLYFINNYKYVEFDITNIYNSINNVIIDDNEIVLLFNMKKITTFYIYP